MYTLSFYTVTLKSLKLILILLTWAANLCIAMHRVCSRRNTASDCFSQPLTTWISLIRWSTITLKQFIIFIIIGKFPYSTKETELPFYHHKVNVRVAEENVKRVQGSLEMRKGKETFDSSSKKLNKISNYKFHESLTSLHTARQAQQT